VNDIIGQPRPLSAPHSRRPTLTLLHQLARSGHHRDLPERFSAAIGPGVPAPRLHEQVDTYLDQLRLEGHPGLPTGRRPGSVPAVDAGTSGWSASIEDDGTEAYSLTSHAPGCAEPGHETLPREAGPACPSTGSRPSSHMCADSMRKGIRTAPKRVRILDAEIRAGLPPSGGPPARRRTAGQRFCGTTCLRGFSELLQADRGRCPGDFARVEEAFVALRGHVPRVVSRPRTGHAGDVIERVPAPDRHPDDRDDKRARAFEGSVRAAAR